MIRGGICRRTLMSGEGRRWWPAVVVLLVVVAVVVMPRRRLLLRRRSQWWWLKRWWKKRRQQRHFARLGQLRQRRHYRWTAKVGIDLLCPAVAPPQAAPAAILGKLHILDAAAAAPAFYRLVAVKSELDAYLFITIHGRQPAAAGQQIKQLCHLCMRNEQAAGRQSPPQILQAFPHKAPVAQVAHRRCQQRRLKAVDQQARPPGGQGRCQRRVVAQAQVAL